jgi:hypothetical protein
MNKRRYQIDKLEGYEYSKNMILFWKEFQEQTTNEQPLSHRKDHSLLNRYTFKHGLLWYKGNRLVVPYKFRTSLLHDHHDVPSSGHPSWTVTYEFLARHYYWPKISKDVKN